MRRISILVLLLSFTSDQPSLGGVHRWTALGPFGGEVTALAIDPRTSIVYAGTRGGGVFRSLDGGVRWTAANEGLGDLAVLALALAPTTSPSPVLYAATDGGLFRSVDGGASWSATGLGSRVSEIAIDPRVPSILYAAGFDEGVWKSTDGGASWTTTNEGLGFGPGVRALAIDPLAPATVYAGADDGVFKSDDGGASWRISSDGLPGLDATVRALVIDPTDPAVVYAMLNRAIFRSRDSGATWTVTGLVEVDLFSLAIDPSNASTLYAGSCERGPFRSTDGGATWTAAGADLAGTDVFALAVDPSAGAAVYAGTDRGVFRSTDGGDAWRERDRGLSATRIVSLAIDPSNPATLYAGGDEDGGVFRSIDGGGAWTPAGEIASRRAIRGLAIDPSDPATLYVATFGDGVFRSPDGGASWVAASDGIPITTQLTVLAIDPSSPSTLYAGAALGLFRSLDGGAGWKRLGFTLNGRFAGIHALAIDPLTPSTLYMGTARHAVWKSLDRASSWTRLDAGFPGAGRVQALAVDPAGPATVYAGSDSDVRRSLDGGASWSAWGEGLGKADVRALEVDPATGEVYAGIRGGVWRRPASADRWAPAGLDRHTVTALALTPDGGMVYAATHGGAVFGFQPVPRTSELELQDGRFLVEVAWRDFRGVEGAGTVAIVPGDAPGEEVALRSADSTVVQFFGPDNWEMLVKVLDGRGVNGHFWVFLAAATTVGLTTTITDTSCDEVRTWSKPLGGAAPAVTDIEAFRDCDAPAPPSCEADAQTFCLGKGGRFRVEVAWTDFLGASGAGRQVRIPEAGAAHGDDSGLFHFFSEDNWELLVKVLDGCSVNGRFWVFGAATTTVEFELEVTDTLTGRTSSYANPPGVAARAISDVLAFDCAAQEPAAGRGRLERGRKS